MKSILTILFVSICLVSYAQQEEQTTQFMYNKVLFNPAVAGQQGSPFFSGSFRKQWAGFDGAPTTQTLRFDTPLSSDRLGMGFVATYNNVGITTKWTAAGLYSYKFKINDETNLSMGINASIRSYGNDYTDERINTSSNLPDGAIPQNSEFQYVPNFGLGLYLDNPKYYVGISSPRLLRSEIDFSTGNNVIAREVIHAYIMGGYQLPINEKITFYPQVLFKYAQGTPFDMDLHAGVIIQDQFHVGATYRTGTFNNGLAESIDFIVAVDVLENIKIGVSYDVTLSELRKYSNGSFEFTMGYSLGKKKKSTSTEKSTESLVDPRLK